MIPAFIYEFQRRDGGFIGWNEGAQRMVKGEGKVKDVCAECNNATLGALDGYGKQFLEDAGILVYNFKNSSLTAKYSYDRLLRWLLKISFNSSRVDDVHSYIFDALVPYILGTTGTPPRHQVALLGYLAKSETVTPARFNELARGAKTFNPFLVRIAKGDVPGGVPYTLRLNAFGPLAFHLVLFNPEVLPGQAAVAIRRLVKMVPGLVEIPPKLRVLNLTCGAQTWLDLYEFQIARVNALGRNG